MGVVVAKIESDIDDNNCDDSCEWAMDGVCDDGSGKGRYWWDDDYGGFYGYDDDYYGYGYYYYGDDDFLAALCDAGTDCHDCGPVGASNYTAWDDDGWWDDDD